MFELITISNGIAVVQHRPSGQVYRFRPMQPGVWGRLALSSIDGCSDVDHTADHHAAAARSFAEDAAAFSSTTAILAHSAELTGKRLVRGLRLAIPGLRGR